jgi:hypothetical protein
VSPTVRVVVLVHELRKAAREADARVTLAGAGVEVVLRVAASTPGGSPED